MRLYNVSAIVATLILSQRAKYASARTFMQVSMAAALLLSSSALGATSYTFTVLAGAPDTVGYVDATGSAARFGQPVGIAVDSSGNLYVADRGNNVVRKVTPTGVVTTLAGSGVQGSADGAGSVAQFYLVNGIATDASGNNIYVADQYNYTVRKVTAAGVVSTFSGTPRNTQNAVGTPRGLAVDGSGIVYVADPGNNVIRKIDPARPLVVTTIAGTAGTVGSADGTGSAALFNGPNDVAVDANGNNIYVADTSNHTIRKITAAGVVTTLAGTAGVPGNADGKGSAARFTNPSGIAVDISGNVYVADTNNSLVRKITPDGSVTTIGGPGAAGDFNGPTGVAVDGSGNVYVVDAKKVVRKGVPLTTTPPAITSLLTASGTVGQAFSYTLTASGTTPITFTAAPLPAGLSLAGATISGTPTTVGTTNVILTATNGTAPDDSKTLVITVGAAAPPPPVTPPPAPVAPTITGTLTATVTQGQAFSYQIAATGTAPITITASSLPDGLTLNGSTISGTPTLFGATSITLGASNAAGADSKTLVLTIAPAAGTPPPPPPTFASPPGAPPPAVLGQPVTFTIAATPGSLVLVTWDFGDGTTGFGASTTHIYTALGVYKVKVTLNDGINTTTAIMDIGINATAPDVSAGNSFVITAATVKFNFSSHKDSLKVSGTVPVPAGFTPAGKTAILAIGDLQVAVQLTDKGKSPNGTIGLSGKLKKGVFSASPAKLTINLPSELFIELAPFGFQNADIKTPVTVSVPILIAIDAVSYSTTATFQYKAKKGKTGTGIVKK